MQCIRVNIFLTIIQAETARTLRGIDVNISRTLYEEFKKSICINDETEKVMPSHECIYFYVLEGASREWGGGGWCGLGTVRYKNRNVRPVCQSVRTSRVLVIT